MTELNEQRLRQFYFCCTGNEVVARYEEVEILLKWCESKCPEMVEEFN